MLKDFDAWNIQKKRTHSEESGVIFYEREVWWCVLGINVGVEIDGRHERFLRPAVVVRKFNKDMALVIPTTARDKTGKYYLAVSGEDKRRYIACLSQLRVISSKRFYRKIGTISQSEYKSLLSKVCEMVNGVL
jgi:mRNA interferase MazF